MNFLSNLTIRNRLMVNAGVIAIALLVMFLMMLSNANTLKSLSSTIAKTATLEAQVLMLRRNEKDFLARKDLKYLGKFQDNVKILQTNLSEIKSMVGDYGLNIPELNAFGQASQSYSVQFNKMVEFQTTIGLNPKDGLYGALSNAVHQVETLLDENNSYRLLADMLQLRRAEKDFMLRRDMKYLDKFNGYLESFNEDVDSEGLPASVASQIKSKLAQYARDFKALVDAEQKIGLDEKSGLLGELRSTIHTTESELDATKIRLKEALDDKISMALTSAVITFIAAMSVTMFLVYSTSQSILKPVLAVRNAIGVIRKNNDLTWLVKSKGKDELVEMAEDVNSLVSDFRSLILNVNKALGTLDNAAEELANNTQTTLDGAEQQFLESDMVATSGAEMQATVADINQNTQLATQAANEAGSLATEGSREVGETANNIQELANQLKDALTHIEKLESDSQSIGTVSDAIRGIAEQTNLLALNAAIEAARAGEQGRGFAVVADEVRSLAMRTQESTSEIENIIASLQTSTQTIVNVVNQCYQDGLICSEQAQSAGESLQNIARQVNEMVTMNSQISTALQEQDTVATEMSKHVIKIRDIAETSKENANVNAEASRDIAEQASILHNEIEKFKTERH